MKRADMVCKTCTNFNPPEECRLNPVPEKITAPDAHWCAHGVWRAWSERWRDYENLSWSDWNETD